MKYLKNKIILSVFLGVVSIILLSLPGMMGEPTKQSVENQSQWVEFIGSFHPLFLHLPIGFLLLILSMEAYSLLFKKEAFPMSFALVLNALAAVVAALCGFVLYRTGGWSGEAIDDHLWQGLIFAVVAIWLPLIYSVTENKGRILYYVSVLGAAGIMFSAAHQGGVITHGDPLDKAPWNKDNKKNGAADKSADPLVYKEIVAPILENKCYSCHSEEKQKGGLRLDSIAFMLEGGDDDVALVKGDAMKSPLISSIHLPMEEDEHMPPENKPQITNEELAILTWWVNEQAPEGKNLSEFDVPADVLSAIGAEPVAVVIEIPDDAVIERAPESVAKFNKVLEKYPVAISWKSSVDPEMNFSAASMRKSYTDADLPALYDVASSLEELDLNGTEVTDQVAELLEKTKNLKVLDLAETKITDEVMDSVASLRKLEKLVLHSTSITDEGIAKLRAAKKLEKVFVWRTKVSAQGARELREYLQSCDVVEGDRVETKPVDEEFSGSLLKDNLKLTLSSKAQWHNVADEVHFLEGDYSGENGFNFHTSNDIRAHAIIDMGKEQALERVIIYNRPGDLGDRASFLSVAISSDGESWETVMPATGKTKSKWDLSLKGKKARYLRMMIDKEEPEYLHLRNAAIYIVNEEK